MQIQFFCTIPVIQCKAYETGLELCLVSSVSWATFENLAGKSFLVRKIDKSSVYFFFLAPTSLGAKGQPIGWICTGEETNVACFLLLSFMKIL